MKELLRNEIKQIFAKVQVSSSCHQKYIKALTKLYQRTPLDDFTELLLDILYLSVHQATDSNPFVKRLLSFSSRFCSDMTRKEEKENETHHFLTRMLNRAFGWSASLSHELRYNSCCFITMVLQDIGDEVQLEIELIDEIQKVMLERIKDPKVPVRLKAMSALVRLQDPQNFECPVINAYLQALSSGCGRIRREATIHIAPNLLTLNKIKDRVRDIDPTVRSVAFHKCADIGPMNFKIVEKHLILICGFEEKNDAAKNTFFEYLLPKWLTAYGGNFLQFVGALKLIADEDDLAKMTDLSRRLIKEFYDKHPINDLTAVLPINPEKLVKIEDLTNDITLFWNILTGLLRDSEYMDEYLNNILPELTPFCHYIDRIIKVKSQEKMDEWKFFEYQFDLLNLFEIAENYDFADEVGRRTMQSLATAVLQKHHFTSTLTKKLVTILHKCSTNIEFFTNDMCQLISEIREPLTEEPLSQDQQRDRDFKVAALRVKINILQEQQNEAVAARDYQTAQLLDNELITINKQLDKVQEHGETEKVRVTKSDNETLCRCLDILICVLELPAVVRTTPSLITCKDNFLVPLISHHGAEPHWRILRCLTLFSVLDKTTAEEFAKIICIPIATYRTVPINNSLAIIQSICGVTDLICLYGVDIVSQGEENNSTVSNQNMTKRRLYNTDNEEDLSSAKHDTVTLSYIFEIFLDMLDDERGAVRYKAVFAITALIKQLFPVTPSLLSRILLKWFSPLTEKQDVRLQLRLGLLIETYTTFKNSKEVLKDAIIPTLSSIANAPKTSPLADIDVDNVLLFFAAMMNVTSQKDDLKILALDMCMKISENPNERVVSLLAKLLYHLDFHQNPQNNVESLAELIDRAQMLLENIRDKAPRKQVEKFIWKLRQCPQPPAKPTEQTNETPETSTNNNEPEQSDVLKEVVSDNERNKIKEPQQIKRRKRRSPRNCVVVLEKFDNAKLNEPSLQTIIESSMEKMELDEDLNIETPTTGSLNSSKESLKLRNNVVISETSDSDFSFDNEVAHRRSTRLRKKRIL